LFPKFDYYLDESDSDIVILRRQDGSFVAAFSASGATRDGIDEAAREDYWELVQAHTNVLSRKSQERLSS
jgi:3-oxoacyl-ACP reductase-like protein